MEGFMKKKGGNFQNARAVEDFEGSWWNFWCPTSILTSQSGPRSLGPCQQGTHAFFSGHQTTMGLDMNCQNKWLQNDLESWTFMMTVQTVSR